MQVIEALKKRLNENKLIVQKENGYIEEEIFTFYPPATDEQLKTLPSYTPEALLSFLSQHNGADLFRHPKNGGGIRLFSIAEILEYTQIWDCPDFFIPVGIGLDGIEFICQCDQYTEKTYMWIGEFPNFEDEFDKLPIGYEAWLQYFIIAQGCSFWDWLR